MAVHLAPLVRAAFGAEPGAAVRVRPGSSPAERWLVAVALGGQGRYGAAAAVLRGLLADPRVPTAVAAHAAVTLAAHRRQLGGHAAARPLDASGLRLAAAAISSGRGGDQALDADRRVGVDAYAARVDALVGLAADALGTVDAAGTRRLLDAAQAAAGRHRAWRPLVRIGWVRAESALLAGDARAAVGPARTALDLAVGGGSVRHVLKSRIVLAVAESVAGSGGTAAVADLDAAGDEAARLGLLPLVWPARFAAADVLERASERPSGDPANPPDGPVLSARTSTTTRSEDATRRRRAGATTLSVIERRCDPVGRSLLGEWAGETGQQWVT